MPSGGSGAASGTRQPSAPSASTAAAAAAGGPSTSAAAQPPSAPHPDSFAIEKLQWALAVPPELRQPSMQGFIDSCQCTTEATELLGAAPLAQLGDPAKLQALLLLLKAYMAFQVQAPAVPGICLHCALPLGEVVEQARDNLHALLREQHPARAHIELQPLYAVASRAALFFRRADEVRVYYTSASLANSSVAAISKSIGGRRAAEGLPSEPPMQLDDLAEAISWLLRTLKHEKLRQLLQRQLADLGGLFTLQQLEIDLLLHLGVVHTWAATPGGAYCAGRIDEQQVAAGRAAFDAALALSTSDACSSGLLSPLSNLLRRTGAHAEAEATLRRSLTAARAAGDAVLELNAACALVGEVTRQVGWRYSEVAALVQAMQRCLQDCKPWLPNPAWRMLKVRVRQSADILSTVRHHLPANYASRPLPGIALASTPNSFLPDKAIKKVGACSGCGLNSAELKFCQRCRSAQYCSRECQVAHWKAGHKAECAPPLGGKGGASSSRGS